MLEGYYWNTKLDMDPFKYILATVITLKLLCPCSGIGYQCCGLFQMDARGSVLIEGGRLFPQGNYQAIQFRSCNVNPFAIQLWQCLANFSSCTLKWQTVVAPTVNDPVTINLSQSVNIDPSYRLGLYMPYSSDIQLPVPFGVDSSLAFLFETVDAFTSFDQLQLDKTISFKSSTWTRSFTKSLVFCKNRDCSELPSNSLASISPISDNPNQPPHGQCCEQNSTCGSDNEQDNENLILTLKSIIDVLEIELGKLKPGETLPRCPNGFVPGEYGLGSCYRIFRENASMSEAALTCRDSSESKLVQINSEAENRFLANLTLRSGGNVPEETFWIAAIFESKLNDWFWMDVIQKFKYPISYTKWMDGKKPVVRDLTESCSNFIVRESINYWNKAICTSRHYFICEVAKQCD